MFQIFGSDITDAMVGLDALIVMHQGGVVNIYSCKHILKMVSIF